MKEILTEWRKFIKEQETEKLPPGISDPEEIRSGLNAVKSDMEKMSAAWIMTVLKRKPSLIKYGRSELNPSLQHIADIFKSQGESIFEVFKDFVQSSEDQYQTLFDFFTIDVGENAKKAGISKSPYYYVNNDIDSDATTVKEYFLKNPKNFDVVLNIEKINDKIQEKDKLFEGQEEFIKERLKKYYENDAVLNKIHTKFQKKFRKKVLKDFIEGQVDKIKLMSIFNPALVNYGGKGKESLEDIIDKFKKNPARTSVTGKRNTNDPLYIFYNPFNKAVSVRTLAQELLSQAKMAISAALESSSGISQKIKKQFETKPTDKILHILKSQMLSKEMFDKKGNLNKDGKEFVKDFKAGDILARIRMLVGLGFKSEDTIQLILDEFENNPKLLDDLRSKIQQLTKADQGSEKEMTA